MASVNMGWTCVGGAVEIAMEKVGRLKKTGGLCESQMPKRFRSALSVPRFLGRRGHTL
jgi:hypothetical protein